MQPCSHKPPPHLASSPVLAPQVIGRSPPSPRFLCALVGVYTFTKFDLTSSLLLSITHSHHRVLWRHYFIDVYVYVYTRKHIQPIPQNAHARCLCRCAVVEGRIEGHGMVLCLLQKEPCRSWHFCRKSPAEEEPCRSWPFCEKSPLPQ